MDYYSFSSSSGASGGCLSLQLLIIFLSSAGGGGILPGSPKGALYNNGCLVGLLVSGEEENPFIIEILLSLNNYKFVLKYEYYIQPLKLKYVDTMKENLASIKS